MRFDVVANPGLCVPRCPWSAAVPVLDVLWGSGGWSMHLVQSSVRPLVCAGSQRAPGMWTGFFLHCRGFCSRAGVWSSASLLQQPPVQLWDGQSHRWGRDHILWDASNTLMTHDFSNISSQPRISLLSKKSNVRLGDKNGCSYNWYQRKEQPFLPSSLSCKSKAGETL